MGTDLNKSYFLARDLSACLRNKIWYPPFKHDKLNLEKKHFMFLLFIKKDSRIVKAIAILNDQYLSLSAPPG